MSVDDGFAQRLERACVRSKEVPRYGKGVQRFLAERLGVSESAIGKYFEGRARPVPKLMTRLAAILNVDEAWLSLGIGVGAMPTAYQYSEKAGAGAYLAFGIFMSAGYQCEFVKEPGPVDFYAIKAGKRLDISVTLGQRLSSDQCLASVRPNSDSLLNLCAIPENATDFAILVMDKVGVERFGSPSSESIDVPLVKEGRSFRTEDNVWLGLKESGFIG